MNDRMRYIDRVIASLRQKNPNVRILLAQISPTSDTFRNTNSGLDEYNEKLLNYAQRTTTTASPDVIVDMNTAWSTERFTQADGVHPNTEGEVQLAQRWANALIATGMITPAVPTQAPPTPVPTTAAPIIIPTAPPTAVPTAIVTAAPTQAPVTLSPVASTTRSAFGSKRYALRPGAAGPGLAAPGPPHPSAPGRRAARSRRPRTRWSAADAHVPALVSGPASRASGLN